MPAIENVTRRGAVYWWRRRVRFAAGSLPPITVATTVSLLTKEQGIARRRGAALTGGSEDIRMSLYERIEREGLTAEQVTTLFQEEIVRYRNMLAHQQTTIQEDGEGDVQKRMEQMLSIYAALNADFAVNGFDDYMDIGYVGGFNERFSNLDDESRAHLIAMLSRSGDLPKTLFSEAQKLLGRVDIAVTGDRAENARRIMCEARAIAAATYTDPNVRGAANAVALMATLVKGAIPGIATVPVVNNVPIDPNLPSPLVEPLSAPVMSSSGLTEEQQKYASMTPVEAVDAYFSVKPKARGRADNEGQVTAANGKKKSQPKVWGHSQRRQFRAAPYLFGKSNGGKPLAATTQNDLNTFYDHLNLMPSTHHKSPRHESMSLDEICEEAAARVAKGERKIDIGLDVGTVNRHFANLKKLCLWMATKTPMAPLDFSDFILEEDDRDDRNERDPYTIEQGKELFTLAIWTGSTSLDVRFGPKSGDAIWHDAAYWVMMIVWYSGMRREECCKLLVDDIDEECGIFYFNIRKTHAGTVKTARSVRLVPIHAELRRLGFLDYVNAMRDAGEAYLFPEILPGRSGRPLGDVFFKQVWGKIKPCLTLVRPGQAVHSGRHMVSTELKMLQTFEEFRADLLGQAFGGENAGRYAGATRLEVLQDVIVRIPNVTQHLPNCTEIRLLPAPLRKPRPTREHGGRRKRN
ncbi:integrase [Sphingomonas sp. AX6]|uniref:integrase n=1 Tax=Sphingomonas sp. AX6 TaxID=2653171 RepID=UPI0012F0D157|nr:integrase [Sphingomonas sp. AX6]VXC74842.1 Integrase [Sphingomonas sp. AX6]